MFQQLMVEHGAGELYARLLLSMAQDAAREKDPNPKPGLWKDLVPEMSNHLVMLDGFLAALRG